MVRKCFMVFSFKDGDFSGECKGGVDASNETVWATQKAMAELFGVSISGISRHLVNVFSSGELDEKSNLHVLQIAKSDKPVAFYSLDVIISVGYRVNSIRVTAFRQWATSILKRYMIKGYAVNQNAVSEQKYEDLKRALGLLENVFGQNYHTWDGQELYPSVTTSLSRWL